MRLKEWYTWKYSKSVTAILFIVAYILTIPIRGYEFLDGLFDTTEGVPLSAHLIIIVFGVIVTMMLHWLIETVVRRFFLDR